MSIGLANHCIHVHCLVLVAHLRPVCFADDFLADLFVLLAFLGVSSS